MKVQLFSDAMGEISAKYIDEALTYYRVRKHRTTGNWMKSCVAACLAVVLCLGAILATNAEARAAFVGWVKDTYEMFFVYRFSGEADVSAERNDYRPAWIPDGYSEHMIIDVNGGVTVRYKEESGKRMQFGYIHNPNSTEWYFDTTDTIQKSSSVNGRPADMLVSTNEDVASAIMWTAELSDVAFYVTGFFDEDTLINIAESVRESSS